MDHAQPKCNGEKGVGALPEMPANLPLPEVTELRRLFCLNDETGVLLWRHRPDRLANWNARYAGKPAGALREDGYVQVRIDGKIYAAHRIVWKLKTGADPKGEIDHRGGSRADNRPDELRDATASQNRRNMAARGEWPKGVYRNRRGKFIAQIKGAGCKPYLGSFNTPEEAHIRYVAMSDLYFGEFACASR